PPCGLSNLRRGAREPPRPSGNRGDPMTQTTYLIVGGGMTGDMAAKGIREHDADGRVVLVGAEPHPVYKRPILTKGLWSGAPEEKLWKQPAEKVDVVTGRRIVSLDLDAHTATDD